MFSDLLHFIQNFTATQLFNLAWLQTSEERMRGGRKRRVTPKYTAPSQGRLVVSPSPGLAWREGEEGEGRGELAEARGRGERWEAMGIGEGGKGRGRREELEDGELHTQTPSLENVGAGNTRVSWLHVLKAQCP